MVLHSLTSVISTKLRTSSTDPLSSVQLLSHVLLFATPRTAARQVSLSITSSQSLLKLMSIESVLSANHFILPFSSRPQSFPASGSFLVSQFFTSGGQSIGSFSFSISLSNEYSGLISFRMDWLDLLAVQGTLKSLLQWAGGEGDDRG